ncbi:MAG TPA: amino acid adenylation domain-containing protein [Gammaproteobacteria bacterium]|nr:amino acid adenylation domain-containing protein [Gammaproteobacteria bacterium]
MKTQLQHGVSAQALARPAATAVAWRTERMSYGTLEVESNRLAQLLIDTGCKRGDRIALFMPKLPAAIVGMLGVLKAGATYVPLDPADPASRLARVLKAADCRWILCAGPVSGSLRAALMEAQLTDAPLIGWLDDDDTAADRAGAVFTRRDLDAFPTETPPTENTEADIAQILFTSGSTGTPKGVMITHGSVVQFVEWGRRYFEITPDDKVSQHAPLRFDISTFDVFGALWSGAALHLVPPDLNLLPHKLAHFIRTDRLTQWFSVPSVLNLMAKFDVLRDHDFPSLKRVLFAGEVLPTPTLMYWMKRLPHVRFTNLYGPTETTISSSHYTVPACPTSEQQPIPIGTACAGEELLLLDEQRNPVADGDIGEIYIRGVGVSPGYWRDPVKTQGAFLGDARNGGRIYKTGDLGRRGADGLLYFCGRADTQIKSRGYRIELGEIESALNALPEVRESAVVAIASGGFEGTLICCAYSPAPNQDLSTKRLRTLLCERLPQYMVPVRWSRYDELPKNHNGKTDRASIKLKFETLEDAHGSAAPRVKGSVTEIRRPGQRRADVATHAREVNQ